MCFRIILIWLLVIYLEFESMNVKETFIWYRNVSDAKIKQDQLLPTTEQQRNIYMSVRI